MINATLSVRQGAYAPVIGYISQHFASSSDPMSILLLITDLELGGTPTVVRELAIRLHLSGAEIQVACLSKWGPTADTIRDAGVPVTALNASGASDLKILPRLIRLIKDQPITTVFSFLMHANAIAAAASILLGDVRWIQSIQTTQRWPRWHWMVQRIAQHAADKIVVPSESVAQIATEWAGVWAQKIIVIPNAIDPADWVDAQSAVPATHPRPYPITFLGRLDPIKDVPTLVQAVGLLAPLVHLHVFGDGPDRSRSEQTIETLKAPVTLHGTIARPQAALAQSGLLVLPSLAEGFGLVLIEAMTAGVPVVATDVPGIRDVVRHEKTGLLVPASNPPALAAAIRRIVEDHPLRERLIHQAREDVVLRFSWGAVLEKYRALATEERTHSQAPIPDSNPIAVPPQRKGI